MSTKSQKTEDMLDQTFANFDTEVTGAETQQTQAGGNQAKSGGAAKKSNNMVVFVGVGVAAVGAAAYLFLKPVDQPPQQAPVQNAIQPLPAATPTPVVEQQPAEIAPVTPPTDPLAQAQANVDPLAQANQAAVNPTTPVDPLAPANQPALVNPTPAVDPLAPVNQVAVNTPVVENPTPVANAQITPVPAKVETLPSNVAGANVQSVAVVDELKSMFDKQSNEFKTVLTDIDNRVGTLEGAVNQQKDLNNKFDQRITALEGNKPAVSQVKKSSVAKSTVTRAKKKASVAKVEKNDSAVLLDKTTEQKSKVEKTEKVSLPNVSLHSIYGGRLWVKNTDGSLSTFSVGEKLPSGEVIKEINDESFEVKTDKRVIKN